MVSIDEKRVYGDKDDDTALYVATGMGVAKVRVADDRVGEFSVVDRREARSVAAAGGTVAAATDEDVLVSQPSGDGFEAAGVGPASAVGFDGRTLLAAAEDGRLVSVTDGDVTVLDDDLPSVRAVDGDLLATAEGAYRIHKTGAQYAGLEDVRDVSAPGLPLAATPDGLYRLGNGWMGEISGDFRVVSADPAAATNGLDRVHAATADAVYAREDGEWAELDLPVDDPIADVGYAEAVYGVTESGTLLANAGEGWRTHPLGFRDVAGLAVANE